MIFGFIVIICVFIDAEIFWYIPLHAKEWGQFVSVTGFLGTGLLLGFYLFHIIEKLSKVPWIMYTVVILLFNCWFGFHC